MFEICPKCGNYEWNKEVSVDKRSARCPKCGASWENRAFPLFILTGCSGVGKTTTARRLMERQQDYAVLDGDILFTADEGEYMGWVERIEGLARDFMQCGKPVLWTMAGNLDKLKKACNERFFADIYCLALVCGEVELRRRMTEGRGISDDGWIRDSVNYNNYFLEHDRMDDIVIERLDITVLDPDQAAQQVERWMRSKLAAWRAGGTAAAGSAETVRMPGSVQMPGRMPETGAAWMPGNMPETGAARMPGDMAEAGTAWISGKMPETGNAWRAGGSFAEGAAWRPNRVLGEKTAGGLKKGLGGEMSWGLEQTQTSGKKASWGLEQGQVSGEKAPWGLGQGRTSGEKAPWGMGAGSPRRKGVQAGAGLPQESVRGIGAGLPEENGMQTGAGFRQESVMGMGAGLPRRKGIQAGAGLRQESVMGMGAGLPQKSSMRTGAGFGRESVMRGGTGLSQESIMQTEAGLRQESIVAVGLQPGNSTGQEPVHGGKTAQSPAQAPGTGGAWTQDQLLEKETIPEPERTAARWIWYYGDFEIYHSLKLHARRDEFGHNFPPFWRLDDCRHNVRFRKEVTLKAPEMITVYARGVGNVEIDGKRRAFEKPVYLAGGKHTILVSVLNRDGLPCMYVEGKTIASDESWLVSCYGREWENAGSSEMYTSKTDDPQVFKFCYEKIEPIEKKEMNGGLLYDFGRETFAKLHVGVQDGEIDIFYGETQEEALDTENSYLRAHIRAQEGVRPLQENSVPVRPQEKLPGQPYQQGEIAAQPHLQEESGTLAQPQEDQPYSQEIPARAFRFLYIRAASEEDYRLSVYHEYLPLQARGSFRCSDERLDRIWDTAAYTFGLNSREFFLDGIKRDRWVWSGDAYQSYLINRYLFFDEDICRRTILALRGLDPVEKHINTIMDYSFYWLISIYDYYEMSGDREFVRRIYPRMRSLMEFCMSRLDADGFAAQVEDDWIFIDWADMDKTGAVCAEQLLLARSLEAIAECGQVIGEDCAGWRTAFAELREKIDRFFWDEEKGAFIDSFASGRRNVTRHANIFALLFGYANEAQRERIVENVLQNDAVPQIRTPYFKLYELEALCRAGRQEEVTERIRSYWGAMLDAGATSFWEEYTPELPWNEQLGMYGDKYGKSLCHAWGASPVYLAGRYYLGVRPTSPGYKTFEVAPNPGGLDWFEGTAPVGAGRAAVRFRDGVLEVCTDADGGVLVWKNERYLLEKGEVKRLSC